MKTIDFETISYPGKGEANEDYILCRKLSDNSLIAILADGMGGLSYGADAAKIVSESIMTTIIGNLHHCCPEDVIIRAFEAADTAISKKCKELKCRMGAAVSVALIIDSNLYFAWQGNVRLYKVCNGELTMLNTDHIIADIEGSFLTRCVNGKGFREKIPIKHEKKDQIDRLFLCSDGFYKKINLNAIAKQATAITFDGAFEDDASMIDIKTGD